MSIKRQATTELNHDNWDQDDPNEHEEMGSFKPAPKDVLEKRVIRTAKRRSQIVSDEPKRSVFSGFGGFNKSQPSSFDFLANLTNGNKNSISPASKNDTTVTSTILFNNIPISTSSSNGLFGSKVSTESATKPLFGVSTTQSSSVFGGSCNTNTNSSIFTASKADSTVGNSPFKIQVTSTDTHKVDSKTTSVSVSQVSSTMFGAPPTNNTNKLFTDTSLPFGVKSASNTNIVQTTSGSLFTTGSNFSKTVQPTEKNDEKRLKYYAKLKGLNESVSDWIKKHVEETPLCILTPIFKDYEKYLKEIQDEYHGGKKSEYKAVANDTPFDVINNTSGPKSTAFSLAGTNTTSSESKIEQNKTDQTKGFGISSSPQTSTGSSPFSTTANTTNVNGTAVPFSFGIGKPFSFNSNVQTTTTEVKNEDEDEDTPPKVEYKPIIEENSVYEKRCKVYVKKDGTFIDKGVGTLYIKKIEDNNKHQLLVRANTNLGNVLLNFILGSAIPTQRMAKNNVMMICIPTPDSKPPPVPILLRVKTSEEADELLETLNKYKT